MEWESKLKDLIKLWEARNIDDDEFELVWLLSANVFSFPLIFGLLSNEPLIKLACLKQW